MDDVEPREAVRPAESGESAPEVRRAMMMAAARLSLTNTRLALSQPSCVPFIYIRLMTSTQFCALRAVETASVLDRERGSASPSVASWTLSSPAQA